MTFAQHLLLNERAVQSEPRRVPSATILYRLFRIELLSAPISHIKPYCLRFRLYTSLSVFSIFASVCLLSFSHVVTAEVSLKNGNFSSDRNDISFSGGLEPGIDRVYNSKTWFKGIFGWGWGTQYEVHLAVQGDGTVVVHEYGGGADNIFTPSSLAPEDLIDNEHAMVKSASLHGLIPGDLSPGEYEARLGADPAFRHSEWDRLVQANAIKPRDLSIGMRLTSMRFNYQYIEKTSTGYTRTFDGGKKEDFDTSGKLIGIADANNNSVALSYDERHHLKRLQDNFGRAIDLHVNAQGLVESAEASDGRTIIYRYNDQSELVYCKGVDGQATAYQYDNLGRHNLVAIGYSDGTTLTVSYYPIDQSENVWSVKDRDDTVTTYHYGLQNNKVIPDDLAVSYVIRNSEGHTVSTVSMDYLQRTSLGRQWTYKLISTTDGEKTETVYDEATGSPLSVTRGNNISTFRYDSKGHLINKDSADATSTLEYDANSGKVSHVAICPKNGYQDCVISDFGYDYKGDLIAATSKTAGKPNTTRVVALGYDEHGRIAFMTEKKKTVTFQYDNNSKPTQIGVSGVGAIIVKYTSDGEVRNVSTVSDTNSEGDKRRIALQVTEFFQGLLDIIRPAGVNLSL
jgi:YD repeat-containing protein